MKTKQLLSKVESIVKQSEELSALKGENFNVFQIFDMERDENKMHSRFINTLLDPKGRHGRGHVFLQLFLETIDKSNYFESLTNVNSKVEHSVGKVDNSKENESTGGRIDIYIWNSEKCISIENKIYAGDQLKQIIRYCNHRKGQNKVYYLTLEGKNPSIESRGNLKSDLDEDIDTDTSDFHCISYANTILEWLEKCQKEASDFPIIRETIKQYIITVKRITGQLTNQKMSEDIKKLIIENYASAKVIANNIEKAKLKIVDEFLDALEIELKKTGNNWIVEKEDLTKKWAKIKIYRSDWKIKTAVTLEGQPFFLSNNTIIGLPNKKNTEIKSQLNSLLKLPKFVEIKSNFPKQTNAWFMYKSIFNLGEDTDFTKLLSKETKLEFIRDVSSQMISLAEEVDDYFKV